MDMNRKTSKQIGESWSDIEEFQCSPRENHLFTHIYDISGVWSWLGASASVEIISDIV